MTLEEFVSKNHPSYDRALELGPGTNPMLPSLIECVHIDYIDNEIAGTNYHHDDFLNFNIKQEYDVILESLCMHEQTPERWNSFLYKVHASLKSGGLFIGRHGVSTPETSFEEDHLLFLHDEKKLLRQENNNVIFSNFLPTASFIEQELIKVGLKILFFKVSPNKKLVLHRNSPVPKSGDPDLLEFVALRS